MTVERQDAHQIQVVDNSAAARFEISVDGSLAGFVTYRDIHPGRAFDHTEIIGEYEGMGLASKLIRYALDEARAHERRVLPFCPFVRSYIDRHAEYLDLVAQAPPSA